jgi:hypothetical protein
MVSEDSEELVPGLSSVHRLRDLNDLDETVDRLVTACRDEFDTAGELLEVLLLRAAERMLLEEWNDRFEQVRSPSHDVPIQMLPMVVVPLVRDHLTNAKELTELV